MNIFPIIYEDEILYSLLARYHYLSGNTSYKDTLIRIFGDDSIIPTVEFPVKLEHLASLLGPSMNISSRELTFKHTALPYYAPFHDAIQIDEIIHEMKYGSGKGIKHKIGFIAGSVCKKDGLYYCPKCVQDDAAGYGEAYFHRIHQLQGVLVCNKHGIPLLKYIEDFKVKSRIEFIRLDAYKVEVEVENKLSEDIEKKLFQVAAAVEFLCNTDLKGWDKVKIQKRYFDLLGHKEFVTVGGRIKQRDLSEEFENYWGKEVLGLLESLVEYNNEYNWLKVMTRRSDKCSAHPIRHILLMLFLSESISDFFDVGKTISKNPDLFPCLNPVAPHYKQLIIDNVKVTPDYKTREAIGTFSCSCGFVYSRKMKQDMFKIGRVKQFGYVWESKLRELLKYKDISYREIAREMKCDTNTVIKYSNLITRDQRQSSLTCKDSENDTKEAYRNTVLYCIEQYPDLNRTEIRNKIQKQYTWLYRNDREWLFEVLPVKCSSNGNNDSANIHWDERDLNTVQLLKKEYDKIIENKERSRITKSLLGRRIRKLHWLEKYLDKMPLTKEYLEQIIETVEDYQIRRIRYVCDELEEEKEDYKVWEIRRRAGLKKDIGDKVIQGIENILNKSI